MQYMGGKSRIAKEISSVMLVLLGGGKYKISGWKIADRKPVGRPDSKTHTERERERVLVSLFCGACSVEAALAPHFDRVVCNDNHKYLIALLNGVQNGYELPDHITEEQYRYVKEHKEDDTVLTGFVGFGSSFGGKWFGGYGRSKKYDLQQRSHAKESKNALLRDNEKLKNAQFICMDYRSVPLPDGCVVYADPPYNNTTQYNNERFDSEAFWNYAREVSKTRVMFISELTAPDDFVSVWKKPITRTLDKNKDNQFRSVEQLFVHKNFIITHSEVNIHNEQSFTNGR